MAAYWDLLEEGLRESWHTSKPLECVIRRILNTRVVFVEQANCLECFMAQSKAVFCLERIKYQI